jgi:methionyl aminopeptidase
LESEALPALRRAGRVAASMRRFGAELIGPGARVRDVCEAVDREIARMGAAPAFPTQSSRNAIAAHYCPSPEDETRYAHGDLAKLDIGVHVDGWVVDTALTVNVGELPEGRVLVEAAEAALAAAIEVSAPGVPIGRLSSAIAGTLASRGLRPMASLCGHGVGRWLVHCPPPIPNAVDGAPGTLQPGMVVAIEPFATDGPGNVAEAGPAEVFRVPPEREDVTGLDGEVFEAIRAFRGLPFARRQLAGLPRARVEGVLRALWERGRLNAYPPLREALGRPVAQAEHTLYVGEDGVEVLTR